MATAVTTENRKRLNSEDSSCNDIQDSNVQMLCKKLMKSCLFSGNYTERLYVEQLKEYRDVVVLNNFEKKFTKLLKEVVAGLNKFYQQHNKQMWIGVSNGPKASGFSLINRTPDTYIWTQLENVPFGNHWFSIKSLKFRNNEVILKLKMVRPVDSTELHQPNEMIIPAKALDNNLDESLDPTNDAAESEKALRRKSKSQMVTGRHITNGKVQLSDYALLLKFWWSSFISRLFFFLLNDVNIYNLLAFLRFVGFVTIALFTFSVEATSQIGHYTLLMMDKLNHFVKASTPITLKFIEASTKIIGGIFILITMMWRDLIGLTDRMNEPKQLAIKPYPHSPKPLLAIKAKESP